MEIDSYISTKDDDKYVSVLKGNEISQLNFLEDVDPDLLSLEPFKTGLKLDLSKPRVGLNQEDIDKQITEKGYAIHGASIATSIKPTGSSLM